MSLEFKEMSELCYKFESHQCKQMVFKAMWLIEVIIKGISVFWEGKSFKDWTLGRRYLEIKEMKRILQKLLEKEQPVKPEENKNSIVRWNQGIKLF